MIGGALSKIRVLDLSRILAGPFCTMILGDLGADVIKVERPGHGDDTRYWGPPFTREGMSAYFIACNRNKRSIAIDLKHPQGREILLHLARQSDVLVENFKPRELARMGLGYEDLAHANPRLIYCSITGFGYTGPRAEQPGYDLLIQALGGLMSITGEPNGPPMKVGVAVSDLFAGLFAVVAILAALEARHLTGQGQWIDLALYDSQLAMLANIASNFLISGERPARYGNAHPNIVPYQLFSAKDGDFVLCIGNDVQWKALCEVVGRPDLAKDPRFATNPARVRNRQELIPLLTAHFSARPRAEILRECQQRGIPAGAVQSVDEALRDPQAFARHMTTVLGDGRDPIEVVASPLRLSKTPVHYRRRPPHLGEHTREVLLEVGYSPAEIVEWLQLGVIAESAT
jgi:formyl-CoA transferase